MHPSTEYLLTHLHLQKLSRLKIGKDWPNKNWSGLNEMKDAAEERFNTVFVLTETSAAFRQHELISLCIPFWRNAINPEY